MSSAAVSTAGVRFAAACLVGFVLCGCGGSSREGQGGEQGPPEVVIAKPVVAQTLDWDPYTGRLAALESVEVRSRVEGYLISHHFQEGKRVERGQLLFRIDPRPYQAAVQQAVARRAEAEAQQRRAESDVKVAVANAEQVKARLRLATTQLNRARPLAPSGAISDDELDELEAAYGQADADLAAAESQIDSAEAAVTAAKAAYQTAEAEVDAANLDLGYCDITAPISGRVGRRLVTEGNLVTGGPVASSLTTINSIDPIAAYIDASEQALLKYQRLDQQHKRASSRDVATPVYMALMDERGFPHRGYIDFVDNEVDRATGSIRARVLFPNQDEFLTPGVFVKVRVPGSQPKERVLIPDGAVGADQNSQYVWVVGEGNKVERVDVVTGSLSKGLRVVEEGLSGDERVVIRGVQRCRPGAEVQPSVEELQLGDGLGLPDDYDPVPPEEQFQAPTPAQPQPPRSEAGATAAQEASR